jgi:hypothetical protein
MTLGDFMLMTKAAYARYKGVSRQTVYDWITRGELVLVSGKIDASASERKATSFVAPAAWCDDTKQVNISPKASLFSQDDDYSEVKNQLIPVSPDDAAAIVLTLDDVYPLASNYEENYRPVSSMLWTRWGLRLKRWILKAMKSTSPG